MVGGGGTTSHCRLESEMQTRTKTTGSSLRRRQKLVKRTGLLKIRFVWNKFRLNINTLAFTTACKTRNTVRW